MKKHQSAFTVIELMIVFAILGILAALVYSSRGRVGFNTSERETVHVPVF